MTNDDLVQSNLKVVPNWLENNGNGTYLGGFFLSTRQAKVWYYYLLINHCNCWVTYIVYEEPVTASNYEACLFMPNSNYANSPCNTARKSCVVFDKARHAHRVSESLNIH